MKTLKCLSAVAMSLGLFFQPASAQDAVVAQPGGIRAMARQGFTPEQANDLRERFSYEEVIRAGDVTFYHYLNPGVWLKTMGIPRQGSFVEISSAPDPRIGNTRYADTPDVLALNKYLVTEAPRSKGFIVVRGGQVVFETYPGMRPTDLHLWMSVSKTATSLVVRLLADEGLIDVEKPIDAYVPALLDTNWAGTPIRDILDMASGLDIIETQAAREDPKSIVTRFNLSVIGEPNADGVPETSQLEVIRAAKRLGVSGSAFDYSSLNTVVLALLAEAVTNQQWSDIFQERVWGKMTVEGDMSIAISPDGVPQAHGFLSSRLRDMARYGMLYTPSWDKAAREKIVSDSYIKAIQTEGRKEIYLKGELGNRMTTGSFSISPPDANAWQWDAVWDDGDFYKGGVYGQGLYVSPGRDLVIAWFSTTPATILTQYARRIALDTPMAK